MTRTDPHADRDQAEEAPADTAPAAAAPSEEAPAEAAPAEAAPGERTLFLPGRVRTPDSTWHVLHTRSRQEKALAATIEGMGIACYLPLRAHVRRRAGRKFESMVPLFPSYVFLWGTRDEAFSADRTRRVAGVIRVPDPAHLEWELSNLHLALTAEAPLDPYDALQAGVRARVVAGPFAGVEGLVASRTSRDRLVLQIRMLGTATRLDLDAALVEPLDA